MLYTPVRVRWLLIAFSLVCFIIAVVVGCDWVTEAGKTSDVLVFTALGLALFSAAHLP